MNEKDYLDYMDLSNIIDIVKNNIERPDYRISDLIEEYINKNSNTKIYPF